MTFHVSHWIVIVNPVFFWTLVPSILVGICLLGDSIRFGLRRWITRNWDDGDWESFEKKFGLRYRLINYAIYAWNIW